MLVAGMAGFKPGRKPVNASAQFLRRWIEHDTFLWLTTEDILTEYREVLQRLGVRRHFVVTLNTKDFPQERLSAKVIEPADPIPQRRPKRS